MKDQAITVEVLPPELAVPASPAPLPKRLAKQLGQAPITIEGTWSAAQRWLEHSKRLQEAALFCQVMLGVELIALQASTPKTNHRPRKGESPAKLAGLSFTALAEKELGLSERSAFRFMSMAKAALPRLRKHGALKGFDPRAQPLHLLPAAQQEALSAAVRKMTDGLTQQDFLIELGLAKAPQGSGAKGGARERRAEPTTEEKAAAEREFAVGQFKDAILSYRAMAIRFTLVPDEELEPLVYELERHTAIVRKWIETPDAKRDIADFERQLASL